MRIGITTSVIERGRTGVAQYVFALLRAFAPYFDQHQFALFVLEEDRPQFRDLERCVQFVPVPERFRPPLANIFWHQRRLPALAWQHRLDVLHVPSYRRMLWPRPCALVATIHDLAPFRVRKKYDWKRMLYGRMVVPWLARRQDEIITVSEHTAREVTDFLRLPRRQITVVHNGVDHHRFYPGARAAAQAAVAREYGLPPPFFLYVARLEHPAKNHVRLITAFNQFKAETASHWHLVLAGSDWTGAAAIHAAIRSSPFNQAIHNLGFVPDAALPDLYRAADLLVYPSLYEGFGIPVLEAMACGCPVLCAKRGALEEVADGAAAMVEPEDVGALKIQLTRLSANPHLRDRLQTAGLERARNFDWRKSAAATLTIYDRARRHRSGADALAATD